MGSIDKVKVGLRRLLPSRYGFSGDFSSWKEVEDLSEGYDSDIIFDRVKEASLKVKKGEAAYERDSVIFDQIEYSWPLLSALMWIAAQNNGALGVLDFGGALGSTYQQNRNFLDSIGPVSWNVVEQERFVRFGKTEMETEQLHFYLKPEEVVRSAKTDILLLSCVLPYIKNPYELLEQLMQLGTPYLMIDNTYFNYEVRDRICMQKVPPQIYEASYPCWFLDYKKVTGLVQRNYIIVAEHLNESVIYLDGHKVRYRGFLAKRKQNS